MPFPVAKMRGFYAVLDRPDHALALALLSSARVLQVRAKPATAEELLAIGRVGRAATAAVNAMLVVNDDLDLAHEVSADAIHLGQDDIGIDVARRYTDLPIGVSTHNRDQLEKALSDGADYVAFGPVFATKTKADADPVVGLDGLTLAASLTGDTPLVGIGGISTATVGGVCEAGADMACAISAVNTAKDVRAAAAAFAEPWGRIRMT